MEISFLCPHCGAAQLANERRVGLIGACTACGQSTEIPESMPMAMPLLVIEDRPQRSGLSIFATVLLVFILLGGALMIFGPIFIEESGRNATRRMSSANNMHNLMIALHTYHEQYGELPPPVVYDKDGKPMHSWRVLILPYIEGGNVYAAYDFSKPWDDPHNLKLAETKFPILHSPLDPGQRNHTSYLLFTGKGSFLKGSGKHSFDELNKIDGTSLTVGMVEVHQTGVLWTQPTDLDVEKLDFLIHKLSDAKPGQINTVDQRTIVVHYDRGTTFLSSETPPAELKSAIDPHDGKGFAEER